MLKCLPRLEGIDAVEIDRTSIIERRLDNDDAALGVTEHVDTCALVSPLDIPLPAQ